MTKVEKVRIVQTCLTWRDRSTLNIPMIAGRIQIIDRNRFNNHFVRLDRTPNIEPDIILAVIAVFTKGLTENKRCTLEEAIGITTPGDVVEDSGTVIGGR